MTALVDVSRVDELKALEDAVQTRFGGIDVLMNNAGIGPAQELRPLENWQRVLARQSLGRHPRRAGVRARR